jgi:hypothetical protein
MYVLVFAGTCIRNMDAKLGIKFDITFGPKGDVDKIIPGEITYIN